VVFAAGVVALLVVLKASGGRAPSVSMNCTAVRCAEMTYRFAPDMHSLSEIIGRSFNR